MAKQIFTVQWYETVNGKPKKFSRDFDTKEERNNFMESLKQNPNLIEIRRFTDFEILHTFDEGGNDETK